MEQIDLSPVRRRSAWKVQGHVLTLGVGLFGLVLWTASSFGWRHSALFIIGTLLGLTLYVTAFGFNIGAFFSGIASTSLHGWVWIAAAIPGTWLGVRIRPWFGLENEPPPGKV